MVWNGKNMETENLSWIHNECGQGVGFIHEFGIVACLGKGMQN